ncbi:hypothetical protein BGZ92_004907, partial [Podila epicladia]
MTKDNVDTGSGDVYSNIIPYMPLGSVWQTLIETLKHIDGSKSNVRHDVNHIGSALNLIAHPLWEIARFNIHILNIITKKSHLDSLPFANSVLQIIDEIFNHGPSSDDAQKILKILGFLLSSQFLLSDFKTILDVVAQTKPRRISDINASVVRYDEEM